MYERGVNMEIMINHMKKMFPSGNVRLMEATLKELNSCFKKFKINNCLAYAHFFAHFRAETDYTSFEESFNYSEEGLFKSDFLKFKGNRELSNKYGRNTSHPANKIMIANLAYGGRKDLGNGSIESGDGYRFRGRGLIQVTGRYNYTQATAIYKRVFKENVDFVKNPDLILQPKYAVRASFADLINKQCQLYVNQVDNSKLGIERYRKAFNLIMDKVNKYSSSKEKRWGYFKENFTTVFQCKDTIKIPNITKIPDKKVIISKK